MLKILALIIVGIPLLYFAGAIWYVFDFMLEQAERNLPGKIADRMKLKEKGELKDKE